MSIVKILVNKTHLFGQFEFLLKNLLFFTDCLRIIVDSFDPKRTKPFIINKMINLGLIASKDEILPSKRKRAAAGKQSRSNDSSDNDDGENNVHEKENKNQRPMKNVTKSTKKKSTRKAVTAKISLNISELRSQIGRLEESLRPVLEWLEQSLNDAAEDLDDEDPSDDPDDCVPLVPFTAEQRSAIESPEFQELLKGLGFQQPGSETETYWRIPQDLTAADIRLRARIVAGVEVEEDVVEENKQQTNEISDAESEDYDFESAKLNRVNTLVYNQSDDEEERNTKRATPTKKPLKNVSEKPKRKFDIFDMVKDNNDDNSDDEEKENESTSADSIARRSLVAEDSDSDAKQTIINQTTKRSKRAVIESDDDDNDNEILQSTVNPVDMSDEIMDSLVMEDDSPKKPVKRIRSLGSEELDAEEPHEDEEVVVTHQVKRKRAAVISDDEDD